MRKPTMIVFNVFVSTDLWFRLSQDVAALLKFHLYWSHFKVVKVQKNDFWTPNTLMWLKSSSRLFWLMHDSTKRCCHPLAWTYTFQKCLIKWRCCKELLANLQAQATTRIRHEKGFGGWCFNQWWDLSKATKGHLRDYLSLVAFQASTKNCRLLAMKLSRFDSKGTPRRWSSGCAWHFMAFFSLNPLFFNTFGMSQFKI